MKQRNEGATRRISAAPFDSIVRSQTQLVSHRKVMGSEVSKEATGSGSGSTNKRRYKHKVPQRTESEFSGYPADGGESFTDTESKVTLSSNTQRSVSHTHSSRGGKSSNRQVQPEEQENNPMMMNAANEFHHSFSNASGDPTPGAAKISGTSSSTMISGFVPDEEVKVNLAMADLMAYLQVVANNSYNLPQTRRDDPELGKTVSNLTAEEYARKSAAFLPADVRVIAGSFTKYGRVWDLPTSEEFNAVDGAHEPGRSYGGACANAMLKVLYDAANEAIDGNATDDANAAANNALFDDDDDSALLSQISLSRDRTFQSLTLGDVATQSSITWADLMRKMKAEIAEIEYAQAPTITSTRKFDLNQPFTLIPADFDETKNKKRSLLIGCNYGNIHGAELKASHDDIRSVKDYIVNVHGFPESKGLMTVLLDDADHKHPTHLNITEAFKSMSEQAQPGDAIFVHFSGHGGRVLDEETYDEVIVPSDFQTSGLVRDTLMFKTLLAPMRYGVTVTILVDCCDTGMMLDLPYSWTTKTDRIETLAKLSVNDDFSFVRFLKVVKTLYESSTFTQLGRTVGSALNAPNSVMGGDNTNECDDSQFGTVDEDDTVEDLTRDGGKVNKKNNNGAVFNALNALRLCTDSVPSTKGDKQKQRDQSFVEKVLNCTMGAEDMSDDDEEDDDYTRDGVGVDPSTTFETEDERSYQHNRRRRGRR